MRLGWHTGMGSSRGQETLQIRLERLYLQGTYTTLAMSGKGRMVSVNRDMKVLWPGTGHGCQIYGRSGFGCNAVG